MTLNLLSIGAFVFENVGIFFFFFDKLKMRVVNDIFSCSLIFCTICYYLTEVR